MLPGSKWQLHSKLKHCFVYSNYWSKYFPSSDLKGSDANGFVQKAIDAANVYDNIIKYIEDANITGLTTLDLATRAEDVSSFWPY